MPDIADRLAAPFDPALVSWRVGPTTKDKTKGMALAYVDARDVMRRLDEVCGVAGWQDEYPWSDGKRVVCRIGIKIFLADPLNHPGESEWIWKSDGAGDSDMEGEKGALSDAFKRAAVKWGVGRYLYNLDAPWVRIEARGNSFVIPDDERDKLAGLLRRQANGHASPPLTPVEKAAAPTERERKVLAGRKDKNRITEALGVARTPALIDEVIERNGEALQRIKELHAPSYEAVMALAGRLKGELYSGA
jgi:hypothetical protein